MLPVPELHVQNHCLTKIPQFQMRKRVQSRKGSCPRSHNRSEAGQGLGTRLLSGSFSYRVATPEGQRVSAWERFAE